jgi:hypothetical protein
LPISALATWEKVNWGWLIWKDLAHTGHSPQGIHLGCPASSSPVSLQKRTMVRLGKPGDGGPLVVKVARESHLENHLHLNPMNSIWYDLCTCIWIKWIIWIVHIVWFILVYKSYTLRFMHLYMNHMNRAYCMIYTCI